MSGVSFWRNNLAGANFAGQNLTHADFYHADLNGADFTGAVIRGAYFGREAYNISYGTGIGVEQLYSTASYHTGDLSGIDLTYNNLSAVDFAGQNLNNANFLYATLTAADFTAADSRGANLYESGAITTNLIRPDGHINGLTLDADELLLVRDDDVGSYLDHDSLPIPITVDQHLTVGPGATLRMVFEADAWDSTISFSPGIPITLGGTLELTFADDVNLAGQVGRTFDLFDWTGVNPTGAFTVASPYDWDLSKLYTTGQVTVTSILEPSSFARIALAVFGLALRGRRLQFRNAR